MTNTIEAIGNCSLPPQQVSAFTMVNVDIQLSQGAYGQEVTHPCISSQITRINESRKPKFHLPGHIQKSRGSIGCSLTAPEGRDRKLGCFLPDGYTVDCLQSGAYPGSRTWGWRKLARCVRPTTTTTTTKFAIRIIKKKFFDPDPPPVPLTLLSEIISQFKFPDIHFEVVAAHRIVLCNDLHRRIHRINLK